MNRPEETSTPTWLQNLQQRSWEPEILISGIVLYGMFQVPSLLDELLFYFTENIDNLTNGGDILIAILKIGVYWLIIGLILHLISRGIWIGVVGLSYTFPDGIRTERLNFQAKYLNTINRIPSFERIILRLEHLCSTLFSISFLLFMSLLGVYLYMFLLFLCPILLLFFINSDLVLSDASTPYIDAYETALLVIGTIGIIDFVTLGYFRRFKLIATLFWPLAKLFSYVTLARYVRPTYYALVTNLNRWWIFGFLLAFLVISNFGINANQGSTPSEFFTRITVWSDAKGAEAFEGYYQDKTAARPSVNIQIPSDIIKDDVLKVFIPARIQYQDSLMKYIKYDSIMELSEEDLKIESYFLEQLAEFYTLSIDDSTFATKMYFQKNSATGQKGYLTYLNISYLTPGLYELKLSRPSEMYENPTMAIVPFYKVE